MRSKKVLLYTLVLMSVLVCSCSRSSNGPGEGEGGLSESELNAQREGRFGEGSIPLAEGEGLFHDVQFEFDSSAITEEGRRAIEYNAGILRDRSTLNVSLEGHCDERGTADYNLALGLQRAKAVLDLLLSHGIERSRLETISYGEEVPLDTGHGEAAWSRNRRVHFSAFGAAR